MREQLYQPPTTAQWNAHCLNTPLDHLPQLRSEAHVALEASGYNPLWNEHISTLERIMEQRGIAATPSDRLQETFK